MLRITLLTTLVSIAMAMHSNDQDELARQALISLFKASTTTTTTTHDAPPPQSPPTGVERCCITGSDGATCRNDPNHCSAACLQPGTDPTQCKNCQCGGTCCGENFECYILAGQAPAPGVGECRPYCQKSLTGDPCFANGECVAPNQCQCKPGFDASTSCETCLPGFSGSKCNVPVCKGGCSNGGTCVSPNKCDCTSGWEGSQCTLPICFSQQIGGCGHGKCTAPGTCTCWSGWKGPQCYTGICPGGCANGGVCYSKDACDCTSGWKGSNCTVPICGTDGCSTNGKCTAPDTCTCESGWTGSSCTVPICGTDGCSTNGKCTAPDTCTCESGWKGSQCKVAVCAFGGCSNGGTCVSPNKCDCIEGYTGNDCKSCSVGWWSAGGTCEQCQCGGGSCDQATGTCAKSNSPSPRSPTPSTTTPPKPQPAKPSSKTCLLHVCLDAQQWRILALCSAGVGILIIVLFCIGCYVRCTRSRREELQRNRMGGGGAPITRESLLRPLRSMVEEEDVLLVYPPPELQPPAWRSKTEEKEDQHVVHVFEEGSGRWPSSTSMSSGMSYPPPEYSSVALPSMKGGTSISFDYSS